MYITNHYIHFIYKGVQLRVKQRLMDVKQRQNGQKLCVGLNDPSLLGVQTICMLTLNVSRQCRCSWGHDARYEGRWWVQRPWICVIYLTLIYNCGKSPINNLTTVTIIRLKMQDTLNSLKSIMHLAMLCWVDVPRSTLPVLKRREIFSWWGDACLMESPSWSSCEAFSWKILFCC